MTPEECFEWGRARALEYPAEPRPKVARVSVARPRRSVSPVYRIREYAGWKRRRFEYLYAAGRHDEIDQESLSE